MEGNCIEFKLWGRYALFTDPLTKLGGEKFSYHIPTYEALKGVCKSIYWKPTIIWIIDDVRVMKRIRTQAKGIKTLPIGGGPHGLHIYTFLFDVEYQVRAHFEWNLCQGNLKADRLEDKHRELVEKSLRLGGRQDISLGTRDCQGYVEPCVFGDGVGELDDAGELGYGLMFHGFDYPDETGVDRYEARFWRPVMQNGVLHFTRPAECPDTLRKFIRPMKPKIFGLGKTVWWTNPDLGVVK